MSTSVKRNFTYNLILTAGNYIFPLLTFPYVSRVLGVSNIGACNYVDNIVNYFILFSTLGIASLGIREVAKRKTDPNRVQECFSSLLFINAVLAVFFSLILLFCVYNVPIFIDYRPFYFVGISKLLLSAFSIEWFFQGISDFKYITVRSLIIKTVYVAAVFCFVREQDDALMYYFLTVMVSIVGSLVNIYYSRKIIRFNIKSVRIKYFLIPIISFGLYRILTSMYTSFNVAFLGFVSDNEQVGYYTTATKLYTVLMSVFSAFTAVMVPKVSELVGLNDEPALKRIANKTFDLIFTFSFPLFIGGFFYADLFVNIIAGQGYEGAVVPFKIVMLLLPIVAMEQIIIQQFLMAIDKSNCILVLSGVGAVVGVSMNMLLTRQMLSVGSSISWVVSEVLILLVSINYLKRYYRLSIPFDSLWKSIISAIPYCLIGVMTSGVTLVTRLLGIVLMLIWFLVYNIFLRRDGIVREQIDLLLSRICR